MTDAETNRWREKKKPKTFVNAGPPDTEHLYYPLNAEGVTQKGSLWPAITR